MWDNTWSIIITIKTITTNCLTVKGENLTFFKHASIKIYNNFIRAYETHCSVTNDTS